MIHWYEELLRSDLSTFIGKALATVNPGAHYLPNWHIDLIAEYLEAVRSGEITRLIINMPPRSLKSVCVSVAWPAWILGHDPASRIIAASYASALSIKHSLDCRQLMEAPWYQRIFPEIVLAKDQNEKHKFMTTQRGFRFATSIGGGITGEGGNTLIIDDPLTPLQAMNRHWRSHVNQWFDHTFVSRLDDKQKGAIVLVMQRLHREDLSGYLLDKGGWEHLMLSAAATKREMLQKNRLLKVREAGELLHPTREGLQLLERTKLEMGSKTFAAQYQQQPLPEEGNMVRPWWLGRYRAVPETYERCAQSWDTAIKSGDAHDASVCLTFLEWQGRCYLVDVQVMRLEYPDLKRAMYRLAKQWQPNIILMEDRASGQQLLQDARRESALPLKGIIPKTGKLHRFAAVSAMIEAGKLLLPEQAPWLAEFERELFMFPEGAHDDQVDALTQYLDWLREGSFDRINIRII